MLSRAATSLWVLGRQLERADHLARVLDVHIRLSLDRSNAPGSGFWSALIQLAGWPAADIDSAEQAVELVVSGLAGPSVGRSVSAARAAAQAVRPSLPSEFYEQLNSLYWRVQANDRDPDVHGFLYEVQMGIHLIDGLLDDTMPHDEPRDFVRLGKFLERAGNVATLVIRKSTRLADSPEDALEWTAVLKSCFSYESFRSRVSGPVTPERVVAFLLLDPLLPRSARFAVHEALDSVRRIDPAGARSRPRRVLARLDELFDAADPVAVANRPDAFEAKLSRNLQQLDLALRETYFHPSRVASALPGDASGRVPQQQ